MRDKLALNGRNVLIHLLEYASRGGRWALGEDELDRRLTKNRNDPFQMLRQHRVQIKISIWKTVSSRNDWYGYPSTSTPYQ
uniref:Uncharacterized protein n=1 Tax=Romanomermis culicivorax TaxID=13658 RepID=A0A915HLB4_ROMCU